MAYRQTTYHRSEITVDEATTTVGELVLYLQQNLQSYTGITVSDILKAGSLGHGTAVPGDFDLDLVLYSRDFDAHTVIRNGYDEWLCKLRRFLEQIPGGKVNIEGVTNHAVQFKYDKIDVDLLVSPYWSSPTDFYQFLSSVPATKQFDFSVNASKWQVEFFRKQPEQVKEFAKRAKAWRNKMWPKSTGGQGRPKSYLISLLVLRAHEKASAIVGHGASTHTIARQTTMEMHDLVENHHELDIYWDDNGYYSIHVQDASLPYIRIHISMDPRPRIIDPANPTNNLYKTGIRRYGPNERAHDYEPGDGDWTLFKRYIGTLDLTKTVEEIQML